MRKVSIFGMVLIVVFALATLPGCLEKLSSDGGSSLVQKTDRVYVLVKTIVTDPWIMPGIPPDTLDRLVVMEKIYLEVRGVYIAGEFQDEKPFKEALVSYADDLIEIIGVIPGLDRYAAELTTVRGIVRALKTSLGLSLSPAVAEPLQDGKVPPPSGANFGATCF